MTTEAATNFPDLYRSEAFAEDLIDLLPHPQPVRQATGPLSRAGWLMALPGSVAALASAMLFSLPA